jgi:lipopolysaccharide export system protein LptA
MQGVTVRYYGSGGITYVVTGDSGTIEVDSKNMEIYGNVNMETSDGYVMKSQSLFFESKKRVLSTQDFIAVVGPKAQGVFELTGKGFRSDLKTNMMNLLDDVKAVRSIGTGREMNIKSDKAKISGAEKYAQFDQRVQVDIEAVRMTGESAHFVYSDEQKALKEMAMNGNVHVTDQTHFASSEQAQVLFDKEEFILKGNPRVVQNDNELRGEEIHLLDGGKSVKVLRARAKVDAEGGPSL